MIQLGNKKISDIHLGDKQILQVYKGSELIWEFSKFSYDIPNPLVIAPEGTLTFTFN